MRHYPDWVYKGYTHLIPRNTDVINYKRDYGDTGKCTVKWCRQPNSWWTCFCCGAATCKMHQEFDYERGIVIKCYYCNGTKKWQRLFAAQLKKNDNKSNR